MIIINKYANRYICPLAFWNKEEYNNYDVNDGIIFYIGKRRGSGYENRRNRKYIS